MPTPKSLVFSDDDDSLDLEMDCTPIPPTPEAKKTSFTIPKMSSLDSSLPTSAERLGNSKSTKTKPTRPRPTQPRPRPTKPTKPTKPRPPKILLSEGPKKMVWTELGKINQVRLLQSKAHSISHNIREARARDSILPIFEVNKSLPQLPGVRFAGLSRLNGQTFCEIVRKSSCWQQLTSWWVNVCLT